MRFWIARNAEIPVREQIVTQVTLAIASGELGAGDRLPSRNEIARRFHVHANTVSHAYRELADGGWIEFRNGSGFYVRETDAELEDSLERVVAAFLRHARSDGFAVNEIRECFERLIGRSNPDRILLLEDDPDYREILAAEIQSAIGVPVESRAVSDFDASIFDGRSIVTAMFDERPRIPPESDCVFLNTPSVVEALLAEQRPEEDALIAVVSGWEKFLWMARTMLVAVRIDPERLIIRSTAERSWRHGTEQATIVICDALTARHFTDDRRIKTFRLIADESLQELRSALGVDSNRRL